MLIKEKIKTPSFSSKNIFCREGYRQLIQSGVDNGYEFIIFNHLSLSNSKSCLLRHDVDIDPGAALEMAQIENQLGVTSTYFMMLRSPVYNLFSRFNQRMVENIISLGHEIGLHYDEGFYLNSEDNLEELITKEVNIIESMFRKKINVISFHQPSQRILNQTIKLKNYLNTYDKGDMKDFFYLSDSNKVWGSEFPLEVFEKQLINKIQLLIHPLWWMTDDYSLSTEDLWDKALLANWKRTESQIVETERAYGKERVFSIKNNEM